MNHGLGISRSFLLASMAIKFVDVIDLKVDDLCDLSGDPYADDQTNAVIDYEYIPVVEPPKQETPECVLVKFDFDWVGFPNGHKIKVKCD